jgi:hypothetical protein
MHVESIERYRKLGVRVLTSSKLLANSAVFPPILAFSLTPQPGPLIGGIAILGKKSSFKLNWRGFEYGNAESNADGFNNWLPTAYNKICNEMIPAEPSGGNPFQKALCRMESTDLSILLSLFL